MRTNVADTNALVRRFVQPAKLGRRARQRFDAIDAGSERCLVPAIVLVEWWMLYERGRLSASPARLLEGLSGHPAYDVLPLDVAQAMEFGALTAVRDPVDRLVAAAARSLDADLLSSDGAFDERGLRRVWD